MIPVICLLGFCLVAFFFFLRWGFFLYSSGLLGAHYDIAHEVLELTQGDPPASAFQMFRIIGINRLIHVMF